MRGAVCSCVCSPFKVIFYAHVSLPLICLYPSAGTSGLFSQLGSHSHLSAPRRLRKKITMTRSTRNVQSSHSQIGKFINYGHIVANERATVGIKREKTRRINGKEFGARTRKTYFLYPHERLLFVSFRPVLGKEMKSDRKRANHFSSL